MSLADDTLSLVADVGGTNARFALSRRGGASVIEPGSVRVLRGAQYPSLAAAARSYLRELDAQPARAVVAVAGPVVDETVRLTNSPWTFSRTTLCRELGLRHLRVVNDFAAMTAGVPELGEEALRQVGPVARIALVDGLPRVAAVVGPGTGLGVGLLVRLDGCSQVIDTEGGHAAFAPLDELEVELWRRLAYRHGRVSNERLISGPGLVDLHRALCEVDGVAPTADLPEEITAGAEAGRADCVRAVQRFVAILGSVCGDIALATGSRDGVYLAGGLVAPLLSWLQGGEFRRRFEDKGRVSAAVIAVPTVAVVDGYTGLLGAGAIASTDRVSLTHG